MRKVQVQMALAALGLLVTVGIPATGHAAAIIGTDGAAGSNGGIDGSGGDGGDGSGNTGSGGGGTPDWTVGEAGIAGSNGTGGGGGAGGGRSNGGVGGNSDFATGGGAGTITTYAKGGGEEAGGGGGFGGSSSIDSGAGGGGGGGRGATIPDDTATIDAADSVTGGNGGDGGNGMGSFGDGGGGGGGGIGVVFTGANQLTVNGTILGGDGGSGGDGGLGYASLGTYAGGGGNGGSGLRVTQSTATVIVNATVTGGNGGMSGISQFSPAKTVGGVGGAGLVSAAAVENNGTISGGNGGAGANALDQTSSNDSGSGGGIGGAGGNGLVLTGTSSSSNSTTGIINGGNGGDGGDGGAGGGTSTVGGKGGKGGAGGIGLLVTSSGTTFTNEGTINGGAGGAASVGGAGNITQSPPVLAAGGVAGVGGVGVSGSNLTLINEGSIAGGLGGDGVTRANAVTFTGGANTLELWTGSTILGNVVGTGSDTLALGGKADGTFDISAVDASEQYQGFSALEKSGISNWTLTGTQTTASAWAVNDGTLSVNGDISSTSGITVNNGGTIGGTGTLGYTTVNSGGTLAPGNSIGTLSIAGDLTFAGGANYDIEVSPTTVDRTNVTGTADLAGTVNATYAPGAYTARQYTILNATNGITGTFDTLNGTNLPSTFLAALSYDNNNVYLDLTLHFPAPGGTLSTNQQNVADALGNYFYTNGGIQTPFTTLDANGLSQIAGETGGSVEQSVLTGTGFFMGNLFGNAFGTFAPATGQSGGHAAFVRPVRVASIGDDAFAFAAPHEQIQHWSAWAAGYGGYASVSGNGGTGTHDTANRVYGATVGATYHASPDLSVGIALGGASSDFGVAQGFGSGEADAFNAALYGRQVIGSGYVAAALAYTLQDATTDRTVSGGGATDVLHASFHPQALTTRLETGWRFATGSFGITPYAAIQTTTLFMPSYGETVTSGPGLFALSYDRHNFTATRGEIGPRFDTTIAIGDKPLALNAKTAWAHDWNNDRVTTAAFQQLPGASFTVSGAKPSANSALLSFNAGLVLGRGWSVNVGFDGEFSHTTESYLGRGELRYEW